MTNKEPNKDFRLIYNRLHQMNDKSFEEAVTDVIVAIYVHGVREGDAPGSRRGNLPKDEMNIYDGIASIIAICKEMLVPDEVYPDIEPARSDDYACDQCGGDIRSIACCNPTNREHMKISNTIRQQLLKLLGEKP